MRCHHLDVALGVAADLAAADLVHALIDPLFGILPSALRIARGRGCTVPGEKGLVVRDQLPEIETVAPLTEFTSGYGLIVDELLVDPVTRFPSRAGFRPSILTLTHRHRVMIARIAGVVRQGVAVEGPPWLIERTKTLHGHRTQQVAGGEPQRFDPPLHRELCLLARDLERQDRFAGRLGCGGSFGQGLGQQGATAIRAWPGGRFRRHLDLRRACDARHLHQPTPFVRGLWRRDIFG